MAQEATVARSSQTNPQNAIDSVRGGNMSVKERQLEIIKKNNPADDAERAYHTWIRGVEDIHTFREAMEVDGLSAEDDFTPDFNSSDVKKALKTGVLTVYSSKPIKQGIFVTPSRMEAQSYAGGTSVYSKRVRLSDVAWIDGLQGQYARLRK